MARRLSGVVVAVGKQRWKSARLIAERCPASRRVFLLDDGFQHRKLARDLNILVVDASAPPFSDRLLPAGNLREPLTAMARADTVFMSRCHLAASRLEELGERTRELAPDRRVFRFGHRYREYRNLADNTIAGIDDLVRLKVVVLAALGNPGQFLNDLARAGLRVVNEFLFRDHHPYSQHEIDCVLDRARRLGADAVVTTEKDAVRLEGMDLGELPFWAFRIDPYPLEEELFSDWLDSQMERIGKSSRTKGMEA
jgi:tetraacyldisaccharide 4'-kinase